MLENLYIKNIILIDELNLNFKNGLVVLTGETGSGKSILLDALMMALGNKITTRLLRNGETQGVVIATFDVKNNVKVKEILSEQDIEFENSINIRRTINQDGKSKSFINGISVNQNLLQSIGKELLEIHGQHDQANLLNSFYHRDIIDDYGNLKNQKNIVEKLYIEMKFLEEKYNNLNSERDNIKKEKDYLIYTIKELEDLAIQPNEEEELSTKRQLMMNREKIIDVLNNLKNILDGQNSIAKQIGNAQNILSRNSAFGENILEEKKNAFEEIIDDLERGLIEINEGINKIDIICSNLEYNENEVNLIEERLFLIRNLSRKFSIESIYFDDFLVKIKEKFNKLENQTVEISDTFTKLNQTKIDFMDQAKKLSLERKQAAEKLSLNLKEELIPLKMTKVSFVVDFKELTLEHANKHGIDEIKFLTSMNVGTKLDELSKVASGGELSRFMLALKVILSKTKSVPTLIFDEIDTGVSGAVADAIGERLQKLANNLQVFVITHLAQVASKGDFHLRVSKEYYGDNTRTNVEILTQDTRINEIAKMISGENITIEAINMAKKLLKC